MKNFNYIGVVMVAFLLLLTNYLHAQEPTLTAQVSKTKLAVGERFQLQYSINASISHFTQPDLKNFRILSGPNQSNSMQYVNGRMSSNISFGYILMAEKEGTFTIPPAAVKSNGKNVQSKSITITVGSGSGGSAGKGSAQKSNPSIPKGSDKNLFIKASVSKTSPYVGEQITVTYRLYFREQIVNNNFSKNPSLNGFWSQNIEMNLDQRTEYLDGERYNVADLRQVVLFPQRSGELEIDPLGMTFVVRQQSQQRSRSLFDQFFGSYQDVKREVKSNRIKIKVKPLPPNQPEGYAGAVGNFKLNVESSKANVKANESIDLKIKVSGTGNLKLLQDPELKLPSDFETYDPEVNDKISIKASGVSGSRTYHYLIIPRHKGNYSIDPIKFSYFDPASKKYKTLQSEPIPIAVAKGDIESEPTSYSNISKEDVKIIGSDIKYIKSGSKLEKKGAQFFGSILFYILLIVPLLLFISLLWIQNYRRKFANDKDKVRSSKATKIARKRLSVAQKHLKEKDKNLFYEELSKALYGYAADKLNMNYGDISKEKISEEFSQRGLENESLKQFLSIIETCEMARFAPINADSNEAIYNQATEIIKTIENGLKV